MSADLGQRWVVEQWTNGYRVTDLSTGQPTKPRYLKHADAQAAADRLNPRRTPTTQQGDLFDTQQEA